MVFPFQFQFVNAWFAEMRKHYIWRIHRCHACQLVCGKIYISRELFLIPYLRKMPKVCSAHKDLSFSQIFRAEMKVDFVQKTHHYCTGTWHAEGSSFNTDTERRADGVWNRSSLQPTSRTSPVLNEALRGVSCVMTGPLCQSVLRWHGSVLVYTDYRPRSHLSTILQYLCHSQCWNLPLGHCLELPNRNTSNQQFTTINCNGTQGLSGVNARAHCWIQSDLYCTLISPMMTAGLKQKEGVVFTQLTCL